MRLGDERAAGDLGAEGDRPLGRVAVDGLVGEADADRLVDLDLAAREAQLLGPARPDEAGQALRPAAAGDDPEQDLGLPEDGPRPGDAVVAGQRQLAAAAERVAGDGGDHEPRDRGDRVEGVVEAGRDRAGLVGPAELGDVGAGGEDPLAARDRRRRRAGRRSARRRPRAARRSNAPDSALTFPFARVTTATPSSRRSRVRSSAMAAVSPIPVLSFTTGPIGPVLKDRTGDFRSAPAAAPMGVCKPSSNSCPPSTASPPRPRPASSA